MIISRVLWRAALAVVIMISWSILWAASASAVTIAMVTDAAGEITVVPGRGKGDITILTEIEADLRLQLAPPARLVVIYLMSGDEYTMRGPGVIEFRPGEPVAVSGAQPVRRANPLATGGTAVRIKPVGVTQAAFVMRSARPATRIKLLNLNGTKTLESRPEFRWQGLQPGLDYRIDITDDTGHTLQETTVVGSSFKLPESLTLVAGANYTWEVSARLPDGHKYLTSGDFSLASVELRAQAEAMRPSASAPFSARVVYAAWLDQMELKDEAHKYWRTLFAERPEDARLKSLASE